MSLTEEEVNQLFTVAVLAFRAVESIGAGVENNKLPGKMPELDSFLANGVDDRLWNKINEVADSSKKPPFFLTKLALDLPNKSACPHGWANKSKCVQCEVAESANQ